MVQPRGRLGNQDGVTLPQELLSNNPNLLIGQEGEKVDRGTQNSTGRFAKALVIDTGIAFKNAPNSSSSDEKKQEDQRINGFEVVRR